MSIHQEYYPTRIGNQIIWLRNFRNKISGYTAPLGYISSDIITIMADTDRVIWLLDTVNGAARQFDQAVTAYIRLTAEGPENAAQSELPSFVLPASPTPPADVAPGALKRLFRFIKNLKTRSGYTISIGEDLGSIGEEHEEAANATPAAQAVVTGGQVQLKFTKMGHTGVWNESQVAGDTVWSYLAIDTSSPYNDSRPLRVAGQPEMRRYRLCYWDGDPTKNWGDILSVTFGG